MFHMKHFLRGLMNIFKFLKSHNLFVFCLIFSFCLCFIRPIFSFASNDYSNTIGSYYDGSYVDYPFPNDDLLSFCSTLIPDSGNSFPIDYQTFVNLLDTYSLTTFFENWDSFNPSYFVDVYYRPRSVGSTSSYICIIFNKSLLPSISYSSSSNFLFLSGSPVFSAQYLVPLPFSVPLSSSNTSYKFPALNPFASSSTLPSSSVNFSSTYSSNLLSYNSLIVGGGYTSNFGSYVSAFLSDSSYTSCICHFYLNNSSISRAYVTLGYSVSLSSCYPLFNSQPLYVSNIGFALSGFTFDSGSLSNIDGVYPYLSSDFTFSLRNHGLVLSEKPFVTPTPIPSPEWVSPTPFPTVTLSPIDLTPIPQYLDPTVLGSDGNFSDLNGFAGLLDSTFSNFDIFSLGSSILEYFYSFSGYFSFILIIPVICLIAFALGRLNQK